MKASLPAILLVALCTAQCGGEASDAERTYLGLEESVGLAVELGLKGFNAPSGTTVLRQLGNGKLGGTLAVSGTINAGASSGKVVLLDLDLAGFCDRKGLTYRTEDPKPELVLNIKAPPAGPMTGSLQGLVLLEGDLNAEVTLQLTLSAQLERIEDSTKVRCKEGSLHVSGLVTSSYGKYQVEPEP